MDAGIMEERGIRQLLDRLSLDNLNNIISYLGRESVALIVDAYGNV